MLVKRRMGVVEADRALLQEVERLSSERREDVPTSKVDRVLGKEERARLEASHDHIARKDARRCARNLLGPAHHEAVPATFVARLGVVTPVRLGIEGLEDRGPVICPHVRHPEIGIESLDEVVPAHVIVFSARVSDCRSFRTGSKRSPWRSTRACTAAMVNSSGSRSSLTSSQRSGVDTGAPGRGRTEYALAIVFPSPFWFASISTPRRFAFDHSVVTSPGCALAKAPAITSAKLRVSAYLERRSIGTSTWIPSEPLVFGYPSRPTASRASRTRSAT